MEIVMRGAGREKALVEIAQFFETHCPAEYKQWVKEMLQLKKMSRASYTDKQGRETLVTMKVPTKLFMACQRVMPDFGQDSDDIALLTKVLRDLSGNAEYRCKGLLLPHNFPLKTPHEQKSRTPKEA